MGLPWVQAPSEGEAQAAHMTKRGDADYCASQDYDSLLFGAPKLLRNVTISGRRKLPSKNIYVDIVPEVIELAKTLSCCDITYEQLIDVGILIGTDFNPDGIKGLGPKTALKLIKEHGTLEAALPHIKNAVFPVEPAQIREIFLHPNVTDNYKLEWKTPNDARHHRLSMWTKKSFQKNESESHRKNDMQAAKNRKAKLRWKNGSVKLTGFAQTRLLTGQR